MGLVEYEKKNHLVTIRMNRPEKLNAFNFDSIASLRESWIRYRDDDDAWVAIFTGAGRAFSVGADKSWLTQGTQGEDFLSPFLKEISKDPYWSGELDKPTIAAVNGFALGGGVDLVLKADLRVAAETAKFQIVEPALGGLLILWDNLPYAIAAELLSGGMLTAQRAFDLGMLNKVVPDGQLMDAAKEMAEELLSRAPLAVYHALRIVREVKKKGIPGPYNNEYCTKLSKSLYKTEDGKEAMAAFLGNRKPAFKKK